MKKQRTKNKKINGNGKILEAIGSLARATKKGFDSMVSKDQFNEFRGEMHEFKTDMIDFKKKTETTLFAMDSKLGTVDQRLDAIEKTLGPLVHVSSALQREIREHNERITLIEHRLKIAK